jgi:8-oxo-(d)GTP phosphatase
VRIVVVRHGQAVSKKDWAGKDGARPLVGHGRQQAERLDKVIGSVWPSRVISSPALRCVQTVQPFAADRGLDVELSKRLSPTAGPSALGLCRRLAASEPSDSTIVLCTHREVLVELLPTLAKEFDRRLGHRPPGAKGGVWVLRFRNRRLAQVDYRPPAI